MGLNCLPLKKGAGLSILGITRPYTSEPKLYLGLIKQNNTARNYRRFKVQKGVSMHIRGLLNLGCRIINVSRGGLAFIYHDTGNRPGVECDLDIFIKKDGFIIKNLSAKIISDFSVPRKFLFRNYKKRRCGAQFVGLIHNQVEQLEYFIKHYTDG